MPSKQQMYTCIIIWLPVLTCPHICFDKFVPTCVLIFFSWLSMHKWIFTRTGHYNQVRAPVWLPVYLFLRGHADVLSMNTYTCMFIFYVYLYIGWRLKSDHNNQGCGSVYILLYRFLLSWLVPVSCYLTSVSKFISFFSLLTYRLVFTKKGNWDQARTPACPPVYPFLPDHTSHDDKVPVFVSFLRLFIHRLTFGKPRYSNHTCTLAYLPLFTHIFLPELTCILSIKVNIYVCFLFTIVHTGWWCSENHSDHACTPAFLPLYLFLPGL